MKAVLLSIQPYYLFLIIAKKMGWNIDKEKTVEVRKTFPKDENWNKVVKMYCTKSKNSFSKIPEQYQPLMKQFLGKVAAEFICDDISKNFVGYRLGVEGYFKLKDVAGLTMGELMDYGCWEILFGWHISDLVIYDEPKELREFYNLCFSGCDNCKYQSWDYSYGGGKDLICAVRHQKPIKRPPQSWCYVEALSQ